jgi:hypothetical protein
LPIPTSGLAFDRARGNNIGKEKVIGGCLCQLRLELVDQVGCLNDLPPPLEPTKVRGQPVAELQFQKRALVPIGSDHKLIQDRRERCHIDGKFLDPSLGTGHCHGASDDLGFNVAQDGVHVHDFQATLLHLLGIDHERLTYRFQGRDFRLTDVHGKVVGGIMA